MDFSNPADLISLAQQTGRTYVRIKLDQSGEDLGSAIIELYTDVCPKTCQHFLKGVVGTFPGNYAYKNSPIHRIVKHSFIQGGDVVDGTGKGFAGFHLADETFAVKHDDRGLIGMANNGAAHTASTQFYLTLKPLSWLDGKRVLFGKVIDNVGLELLDKVESLSCQNERPIPEVTISDIRVVAGL